MKQLGSNARRTASLRKQQGMTLLEVLVATGIMVVVSGMAFISLDTLVKAKQTLQQATQATNQLNLAQYQLQTDIQMAISSRQTTPPVLSPEFIANSQTITLQRYRNVAVPNQRLDRQSSTQSGVDINQQQLVRIRWYVRNNQWIRASQSAAIPLSNNQWQERVMLDLKSLQCNFMNVAGNMQTTWPIDRTQNAQLPEVVNCRVTLANDQDSVLKMVPWQQAGWL